MNTLRAWLGLGLRKMPPWATLGLSLSVMTALLGWSGWTHRLDMAIHDAAQRVWQSPPPAKLVIVAIDDASLQSLGRWPWKRATHARLLQQLQQAQPNAVLLHVLFSEPDPDPQQDQLLADALKASGGNTVLPLGFTQVPGIGISPIGPVASLTAHARVGHADAVTDIDGVMRQAYLSTGWGKEQWPHLALLLHQISNTHRHAPAVHLSALPVTSTDTPARGDQWHRQQPVALRFYGPPGSVTTVSYADVLAGAVSRDTFKNSIVLVGATAQGLGDRFMTPVSSNGEPMPSVEIVAQMVGMLQEDRLARWAPAAWAGGVSGLLIFLLMALYWPRPPRQGLLLCLAAMLGVPLLSVIGMHWGIWFAPGAFMLMAAISYPLWSWFRLEAASKHLAMQLNQAGFTPDNPAGQAPDHSSEGFLERQAVAIAKLHEEKLNTYRLIDQLIQQLPCAVLLVDAQGHVKRFNEQLRQLIHAEDTHGIKHQPVQQLLEDWQLSTSTDWHALLQQLTSASMPQQAITTEAQGPQGQSCLVSIVSMRQSVEQHVMDDVIICLTDTTAAKRAEHQRDELLSFIAHDMRSPQASLLSLVELHQMNPAAMPVPDLLKHAENLAQGTLALCEELIHVIRSENSPLQLKHQQIGRIIATACEMSAPQALSKQVTLKHSQLDQAEAFLSVDAGQLQRAVMNLLSNAIRFSPQGGEVLVKLAMRPDTWDIEVHDQGEGISSDNLAKLFRRFSRLNTASNQPNKGFGLGLVFVETVFKRHGGTVQVRSEPGKGSVFTGQLPRNQPK